MKSPFPLSFANQLRAWFRVQARDLPWRRTRDPYAILVSEFMLQQTQVVTVLPYFARWMVQFPTVESLAAATEEDVLRHWQGLGYYSRARNLRLAALEILNRHGGIFPRKLTEMRALPGLGDYTAGAVLTFAFNARVPIVDANIARVLARLASQQTPIDTTAGRRELWVFAAAILPAEMPGEFNAALMELGALICLPAPRCPLCPVAAFCRALKAGNPAALPHKRPRIAITRKVERALFIAKDGSILLQQKAANPWKGMWVLPPMTLAPEVLEQPLLAHRYGITRYQVMLEIYPASAPEPLEDRLRWVAFAEIDRLPIPSPYRRVIAALQSKGAC